MADDNPALPCLPECALPCACLPAWGKLTVKPELLYSPLSLSSSPCQPCALWPNLLLMHCPPLTLVTAQPWAEKFNWKCCVKEWSLKSLTAIHRVKVIWWLSSDFFPKSSATHWCRELAASIGSRCWAEYWKRFMYYCITHPSGITGLSLCYWCIHDENKGRYLSISKHVDVMWWRVVGWVSRQVKAGGYKAARGGQSKAAERCQQQRMGRAGSKKSACLQ